jgi:hypothetical protein
VFSGTLPEVIGSWSWRNALDRRDKFRWIRSDVKDLARRSKVLYSKRPTAAFHVYYLCLSYSSSSFTTIFLRVLLYLEERCCFNFDTLSRYFPANPPPKTRRITALWYLSGKYIHVHHHSPWISS